MTYYIIAYVSVFIAVLGFATALHPSKQRTQPGVMFVACLLWPIAIIYVIGFYFGEKGSKP